MHHFVDWYNHDHKHSQINYMTPAQRHEGLDEAILSARKAVLEAARQVNPRRWTGSVRNCEPVGAVMLNPDIDEKALLKIAV